MMVIVACGARKLDEPAPARDLYRGAYFRACLAYALRIAPAQEVYILSAKYGLVGLNDVIAPYDRRLDDPFAVTEFSLTEQADALGLLGDRVTVLGGRDYVKLSKRVWKQVEAPLDGKGGLGRQMAWMRAHPTGENNGNA